jgi:hypothetical protein
VQERKGVGGEDAEENLEDDDDARLDDAVEKEPVEWL